MKAWNPSIVFLFVAAVAILLSGCATQPEPDDSCSTGAGKYYLCVTPAYYREARIPTGCLPGCPSGRSHVSRECAATSTKLRRAAEVFFGTSSSKLDRTAQVTLASISPAWKGSRVIELRGYADAAGTAASNRELAKQRAEKVRDWIESQCKAPGSAKRGQARTCEPKIEIKPLGEVGLLKSARQMRPNRRVEIWIK